MKKAFLSSLFLFSASSLHVAAQEMASEEGVRLSYAGDFLLAGHCKHSGEPEEVYIGAVEQGRPQFLLCVSGKIMELPQRSACSIIGLNIERNESDAAAMTENPSARARYERHALEWMKARRDHCPSHSVDLLQYGAHPV